MHFVVELLANLMAGCAQTLGAEEVFGVVNFHDRGEEILVDVEADLSREIGKGRSHCYRGLFVMTEDGGVVDSAVLRVDNFVEVE
jgi:hypothetical protein